jgi:hypothetical protein
MEDNGFDAQNAGGFAGREVGAFFKNPKRERFL